MDTRLEVLLLTEGVICRGVSLGDGGLLDRVVPADLWNEKRRLCLGTLVSDDPPLSLAASFVDVRGRMSGREGISPMFELERLKKDMTLRRRGVFGEVLVEEEVEDEDEETCRRVGGGRGGVEAEEGKTGGGCSEDGEPADVFGRRRRKELRAVPVVVAAAEVLQVLVLVLEVVGVVRDLVDRDARRGGLGTGASCGTCRVWRAGAGPLAGSAAGAASVLDTARRRCSRARSARGAAGERRGAEIHKGLNGMTAGRWQLGYCCGCLPRAASCASSSSSSGIRRPGTAMWPVAAGWWKS